ncbi:hypothetical protein [Citricoccus sp. GCM10030269]|uniref:hypothetical protein n=1 Tax=Citricoccus sp. GCM10030269 TaxID=3273388 RepID=UPI0036218214
MTATQQRIAMQQPVRTRESTAPQLDQAAPWQPTIQPPELPNTTAPGEQPRRRTPLSVVPAPVPRTGRGFATLCIAIVAAALMMVLITNITVSNRQYDLVTLKNEYTDVSQANEQLRQQVEHLEAPQNLAAEAAKLGMVNPGSIASVDLDTGAVSGKATPADAADKPSRRVAVPAGPEAGQAAQTDAEAQSAKQPETAAAPDTAESGEPTGSGETTESGGTGQEQDARDAQELNGGTIPAPQFSARGN